MKRNKIMFVIAIVAILAVLFVACDEGTQPEHTHTYGAWTVTTAPTEDTAGSATRACACGDVQTTTVAKLSDTSVWTVTVSQDATHETAGFKAYKSADFGTFTVTVPKGEHAYGAWEISKEPTETETGIARRYCTCGHYDEAVLAVLTNATVWTKTTESATHQAPGKEIYTSEYGVVTVLTSAEQHVYGEWVSNNDGTHSRVCACGDRQTEQCVYNQRVDAPAFLKSAATCTSKAVYYLSCVCGAHSAATFESGTALGHDYYNFQVKSEPTCTEAGQVVADCTRCDQKYDGAIPALGHDFTGDCIPYKETISWGDEGGAEYDGSEYHVHKCTRCDAVDSAHKEKHAFGEATYTLVSPTVGWHSVKKNTVCEDCGFKNIEDAFDANYVESNFFTKGEEVKADYNQPGYVEYTYKSTGETFRIATPQLVAPYVGTTYYAIEVETSENGVAVSLTDLTSARATFDANGKATGEAFPFRGENTIRITDATTGALTYTRVNSTSTYNETGCIDLENGVIVHTNNGSNSDLIVMFPTSMTVTAKDVTGSTWTDSMAFAYNAKCGLNETHLFNVFVYEGNVYFDAQFVDADGNAVAAGACSEAPYVKVLDAEGNKVQAFAQKNGGLTFTDGKEGTYTSVDNTLKLDGVGGFVLNGKSGFYTAAEGASYGYDAYVGADVATATEYYQITLGENNTCTVVKPEATLSFGGEGVEGVENITANVNIVTTLPTPVREGYVFNGWQLNGEGNAVSTFVATVAGNDYAFVAQWTKKTTVTVRDLKDEDKAQYSTVYVGVGNPFVGVLPAYDENTYRDGYKFVGWYLDDGDDVLNTEEDTPLGDADTAAIEGEDYVIFAVWNWQGNVEFEEQSQYGWEYVAETNSWRSTNWHVKGNKTSSTMEIKWTSGIVRIEFDYWVESENKYDYLTIYYYDANGTKQTVSTKGSNIAKGNAVHVVCILDGEGEFLRLVYLKDNSGDTGEDRAFAVNLTINGVAMTAQSSLNKNAGTYTSEGAEDIKVSAGGAVTIGENTYLTSNVSEKVIGVMVGDVYKEYTLDTAAKTYTVVEPKVTVAYNYNNHGTNTSAQVGKYSNQTLSTEVPKADGFVFRGWYTDEALTKAASKTFVASEDVTFYAKWDAAITLTYVYLDGTTVNYVENLYANDKVATLKAVDFNYGTKVFAGWFTKDGSADGDWGDEFVADTTLTKSTTVYAKWIEPSVLAGTYTVVRLDNNGVNNVYNTDKTKIVVDVFGNSTIGGYNGFSYGNTVSFTFEEGSTTSVIVKVVTSYNTTIYKGIYDATSGTIVRADSTSGFGATIYMMVPYDSTYATSDFAAFNWSANSKYYKLVSYADKTAENAQRTVFVADGTVSFDATWTAVDASDKAVTELSDVKSKADIVTIVAGETTYKYAKNNSNNFVAVDGYEGVYDNAGQTIRLNGAGIVTLMNNVKGTYTKTPDGTEYTFDVNTDDATYKLTVEKETGTWEIADNRVTISFVNDKVVVENMSPYYGKNVTLPSGDEVKVDGFVFRGWYDNAEFTGTAKTTVTLTENAKYYAKYDAAVTLTFDYSGYEYETGKTTQVVTGKYINDTLGNVIPTVASDVRHEGKAFVGWFFKDGENWGDQVSSSTALTQEVVTIYAKWIDPAAAMGTYKGFEVWNVKSGSEKAKSGFSTVLTINADGSYSGSRDISGKLSADDAAKANGAINITRYAYLSDALGGIVIFGYSNSAMSVGTDFYIGFANANVTKVEYSADTIGGGYVAFFTVSYTEDGTAKTMNLFVYNNEIIANVMFTDGVTAKAAATTTEVLVKDATGNPIAKKSGSALLGNDGKSGSYNGTELGEVVLDGYGTITVSGQNVAYTLNADKTQATFVLNNQMRVIALGNGTYTLALDGYQGEYTLPDATSKLTLDGHGNAGTGTYVVNGTNITIYNGETSITYGLDVASKTLLGKSAFAGLTFKGTYNDDYNDGYSTLIITFDDSSALSGDFIIKGYGTDNCTFTATLTENVFKFTIISTNGILNGKVFTATLTGNKITITDLGGLSNNAYNALKGASATCADYQG